MPGAAIIDRLSTEEGIDPDRVGVWGGWESLPSLTREAFRVRSKSADLETARRRAEELTMAGRARLIKCPLLAVMGKLDRLIPWQDAQRLVEEAGGNARLLLLEQGNTAVQTWRRTTGS